MKSLYEIRAKFDRESIVVYQAYSNAIADVALAKQRFDRPFSFDRMTWIKPSFLWLMHRSMWGEKKNQERTLAVHIKRSSWEKALELGVLTHPEPRIYRDASLWQTRFSDSPIHVQWDPERNFRGRRTDCYSIQVGVSRKLISEFVQEWVVRIEDITPTVAKIRHLVKQGCVLEATQLLPPERKYPIDAGRFKTILLD